MSVGAIYQKGTGLINQTISPPLSNQAQLKELEANGLIHVLIPDGKNGGTGMIDLATGQYKDFAPQGAQVPNLLVQLTSALVNKGHISSDDLHPSTVAEINSLLAPVNMNQIKSTKS